MAETDQPAPLFIPEPEGLPDGAPPGRLLVSDHDLLPSRIVAWIFTLHHAAFAPCLRLKAGILEPQSAKTRVVSKRCILAAKYDDERADAMGCFPHAF